MGKRFSTLGHCQRCGDTQGPWSLINNMWLCDICADAEERKQEDKNKTQNKEKGE